MIHAKGATIFAGYLKLLPLWIMVFPGMAARNITTHSVIVVSRYTALALHTLVLICLVFPVMKLNYLG